VFTRVVWETLGKRVQEIRRLPPNNKFKDMLTRLNIQVKNSDLQLQTSSDAESFFYWSFLVYGYPLFTVMAHQRRLATLLLAARIKSDPLKLSSTAREALHDGCPFAHIYVSLNA
jgi:hypothetical protein